MAVPQAPVGVSVREYFEEQLLEGPLSLVPKSYELTGNPKRRKGELAEKAVCDMIEKCSKSIPGIKIVSFHGRRVIGGRPPHTIIREVDQCSFITYQGRRYIFIKEVKCNTDAKKSGPARKKAISQLKSFTELLRSKLNVQIDKLQVHTVWPNMEPMQFCTSCSGNHDSLYEKPEACRQPGTQARENPEPRGFHIFKDKFDTDISGSNWITSIVSDPSKAVEESVFDRVLEFVAQHSKGVLYDETVKSFCILGEDQTKLLQRPEQNLSRPTVIYGLGGTGKTISILARIQQISRHLSDSRKALYMCFQDNAIAMVK